jgi:hypothetical protein
LGLGGKQGVAFDPMYGPALRGSIPLNVDTLPESDLLRPEP